MAFSDVLHSYLSKKELLSLCDKVQLHYRPSWNKYRLVEALKEAPLNHVLNFIRKNTLIKMLKEDSKQNIPKQSVKELRCFANKYWTKDQNSLEVPAFLNFWNRVFIDKPYGFDWQVLSAVVDSQTKEVSVVLRVDKAAARSIAWNAFIAAFNGDVESPLFIHFQDFIGILKGPELPYVVAMFAIGANLNSGCTELEAVQLFHQWMIEDEEHAIFDEYRLHYDFSVSRI
jgi:hypothetical protein